MNVQAHLAGNLQTHYAIRSASDSLLIGKIFDDRGNTMSPTYSIKGKQRYRYYVSRAFTQKRTGDVGTLHRVPAQEVETKVIEALRSAGPAHGDAADDKAILGMASRTAPAKSTCRGARTISVIALLQFGRRLV